MTSSFFSCVEFDLLDLLQADFFLVFQRNDCVCISCLVSRERSIFVLGNFAGSVVNIASQLHDKKYFH